MNSWPLVLIVDDSSADAQALAALLNLEYRIKVAHNGADALEIVQRSPRPDLILLDLLMPGMGGLEVCKRLKQSAVTRDIPLVFVTAAQDASQEARALELQAADYITKPYSAAVLRARIRNALWSRSKPGTVFHNGHSPGNHSNGDGTPDEAPSTQLGKREAEVMALIAQGLTSAEIAEQLFIAKGTVEVHRTNIMRKLGVRNIAGLVKCGIRLGLLTP